MCVCIRYQIIRTIEINTPQGTAPYKVVIMCDIEFKQ